MTLAIVRSHGEIRITSDLRQDVRRRLAESAALGVGGGALHAVLASLGVDAASLTSHLVAGAALPWIMQLLMLPNSLGAPPIPSHAVRITETHVALEKYGVEYARISRPVVVRREPWWSLRDGVVLRAADGLIRLRPRALGAAELRTVETVLNAPDPSARMGHARPDARELSA